ncbi:septum formation family protein [Nocardioides bizhenqiangii]|uniref:Septum formation family protein n=1 Tax=Nocardioides bizhenqiangii TaxID=3095076 RepID=A0ABZ0ZQG7_9ACTN|nr:MULTISPECIES: septum formation family protein [unclassified Nocardioides]MDZ5619907.1 septum formation family protein [Nocardioides sp. HM23]WQQ26089.1 septum formation family protein [Nocardioides sp. HM61]
MKLRLGAVVLTAALTPLTAVGTPSPARAGVDITPPEVGSCHAYTMAEGAGRSDRTPVVDCADPHTAITVEVVEFDQAPDWDDPDALDRALRTQCYPAYFEALGGNIKTIQRSAHILYVFIPTKAQREAGAAWLRCDATLQGGTRLMNLPDNLVLGSLPLPDRVAKCRTGKRFDYAYTVCARPHQFRAAVSIRYPHDSYPGKRAAVRFALRKCRARAEAPFFYEAVFSRAAWTLGYRHAVCLWTNSD